MSVILGIDTSCYTTSVALVNSKGQLVEENRKLLPVKEGERGLAQSQALFYHVKNFPGIFEKTLERVNGKITAICASTKPRNVEGSYMPVFTFAESMGRSIAASLKVPFITTSHQEGHIMAGIWSAGGKFPDKFLAVHLSGGTSEILLVKKEQNGSLKCEIKGGTVDLHAGQFVDRVGVSLGLKFPAGPQLEDLAKNSQGALIIPSSVKGLKFSFSGPESHAQRLINKGYPHQEIARAVERCIAKTLEKSLRAAIEELAIKDVLVVGGVAANKYIREWLEKKLSHPAVGACIYFAEPEFSRDNAVGVALIGMHKLLKC